MDNWDNQDRKALYCALQLDNLRQKRDGKYNESIEFQEIYNLTDKLSQHLQIMNNMLKSDNYPSYYLFNNSLIEGIMGSYKISLEDYKKGKRTKCSDFFQDMKIGLEMILESFENIDFNPTTIGVKEINALRDFCLEISNRELKHGSSFAPYRLTA